MNYNILSYLIGEGFKNVFKNKKSTFAALLIMFFTMITVGLGIAGAKNLSFIMGQLEKDVPIKVYLKNDVKDADVADMEEFLKSIDGVNSVDYTSKAQALIEAKEKLADSADILNSYSETNHPFPASYAITLTDLGKSQSVVDAVNNSDFMKDKVKEISSSETLINGLNRINRVVKIGFIGLGILLVVVSTVIISNTIKLTVHARRREISIMKYVGATNNFIRAPFIVEGVVIGIVAIALPLVALGGLYHLIYSACNNMLQNNLYLLQFNQIFQLVLIMYLILGIGIGVLGSMLSMKKYLKV